MKQIKLTRGLVAIVDDEDFDLVAKHKWCAHECYKNVFYATTNIKRKTVRMHTLIMNTPIGFIVDHINGDTLNNQKKNLRIATYSQNLMNSKKKSKIRKYKGVRQVRRRWFASIVIDGKEKSLGGYSDPDSAAMAYDEAAKKYFGEFAKLNFP